MVGCQVIVRHGLIDGQMSPSARIKILMVREEYLDSEYFSSSKRNTGFQRTWSEVVISPVSPFVCPGCPSLHCKCHHEADSLG